MHAGPLQPRILAPLYLGLMPIAWPALPWNVHVADLLFPLLAVQVLRHSYRVRRIEPLDYWVVAYLLALLPSFFVSDDAGASAVELVKRLYLALVYVVFALHFRTEGYTGGVRAISVAVVLLCGVGVGAAALYYVTGVGDGRIGFAAAMPYVGTVLRLEMLTESPAMFASYLTFACPFLFAARVAGVLGRGAFMAGAGLVIAGAVLTYSHALGGLMAAAMISAWPLLARRALTKVMAAAASVLLVLVINAALVANIRQVDLRHGFDTTVPPSAYEYGFRSEAGAERVDIGVSYNLMSYYVLKRAAFDAFLERPWLGVGLGRFETVAAEAFKRGRLHEPYRMSDPHSTLFGALAETGLLGALATLVLLGMALAPSPEPADAAGWVGLAARAAVIGLAINGLNTDIMNLRFLWVGLAMVGTGSSTPR